MLLSPYSRMYDPVLGRFLQSDPAGYSAGMNLYAYVMNDPANATDPSGMVLTSKCPAGFECVTSSVKGDVDPNYCSSDDDIAHDPNFCDPFHGPLEFEPLMARGGGVGGGGSDHRQSQTRPNLCERRNWHDMKAASRVAALRAAGFSVATNVPIRLSTNPSGYAVADYVVRLPSTTPGLIMYRIGEVKTGGATFSRRQRENYGNGMAQILGYNAGSIGLEYGEVIPVVFTGEDRFPGCPAGKG